MVFIYLSGQNHYGRSRVYPFRDSGLDARGGRERLEQVKSVRLQIIGHTLLMEQSYRQAPFITSYKRGQVTFDLVNQGVLIEMKTTCSECSSK